MIDNRACSAPTIDSKDAETRGRLCGLLFSKWICKVAASVIVADYNLMKGQGQNLQQFKMRLKNT